MRSRESLLLPAGPPASTPVTALASLASGNLRCRRGPRGRVHTRAKIAFLVLRKGSSSTGFRLWRTLFSTQLCQLLTTKPLSRTETNITKKKDLRDFPTAISHRTTSQQPGGRVVRNRAGGWARNDLRCERLHCRSIVTPKRMR